MFDIQLKRDDAAGASLFLSVGGETIISEGYGLADVAHKIKMTGDTTLRGGELQSAVVAVAVMQQVEAGKLRLDDNLRPLLHDSQGVQAQPEAFTLRQLLTQTAGVLQETGRAVTPPGAVHCYTFNGVLAAMKAVELVSGEPFEAYATKHIFRPLGMFRTGMEALPAGVPSSIGYEESTRPPIEYAPAPWAPLSFTTTAADMGRLGLMLVNGGTLDGQTVLQPESVAEIMKRQPGPELSAEMPGMALAFHQVWFNGLRFFGLSGDTATFHTELDLDPVRKFVLFVGYNSTGHTALPPSPSKLSVYARGEIVHGIFDRYQPFHPTVVNTVADAAMRKLATGTWAKVDRPNLPIQTSIDAKDGSLVVDRFVSDRDTVKHWLPIGPNLWQQYPQDRIYFIAGKDGWPDRMATAADPANDYVRVK